MNIVKTFSDIIQVLTSIMSGSISVSVVASGDDGYWQGSTLTSNSIGLIGSWLSSPVHDFARFTNIQIPPGASIKNAYVTLYCFQTQTGQVDIKISLNDVDDATAPTTGTQAGNLVKTTAIIDWSISDGWTGDLTYNTPDISAAVQEVIDRPGWVAGNAMTVIFTDNSSASWRKLNAYDMDSGKVPVLHVNYEYTP